MCVKRNWLYWFSLVSLFNGILTFMGYSIPNPSLQKDSSGESSIHSWGNKGIHTFPKGECNSMTKVWIHLLQSNMLATMWWEISSCIEVKSSLGEVLHTLREKSFLKVMAQCDTRNLLTNLSGLVVMAGVRQTPRIYVLQQDWRFKEFKFLFIIDIWNLGCFLVNK